MTVISGCCSGCGATDSDTCTCVAGIDAPQNRHGNGVPSIESTDRAGRLYFQDDSVPSGEVWFFDGVSWTDLGYSLQGATGAAGAAGGAIIYNNHTASATTGAAAYQTLNSFPIPLATLSTDGDQVVLTTRFSVTVSSNIKGQQLLFGATTLIGFAVGMISEAFVEITSTVSRINSTTVAADSLFKIFNSIGNQVGVDYSVYSGAIAVPDLDTNAITVAAQANSFTVIGDITCEFLTVEFKHLT